VNPETPKAALVVKTTRLSNADFSTALGPDWKWLIEKDTQLNPGTLEEPFPDFIVIPEPGQLLHGNVDPIFSSL
jgi:hypothetical protein